VTPASATHSSRDAVRIGVVAPSCQLDADIPDRLDALTAAHLGTSAPEIVYHPQCFLSDGHFAGPDDARISALVDFANDPAIDAIWFARGGYGACRVAEAALAQFASVAQDKLYLGYSDAGFLLAGLYAAGVGRVAHGPMPADLNRGGGEAAVLRALDWLANPVAPTAHQAAFNLTILSQLLGAPLQPDLSGHILMIEEVAEYLYRIDRTLFHITSNPDIRKVAGIMLGRCSQIPDNVPDFGVDEVAIIKHWCAISGIPYLGRADIGHDVCNQVVPFG
jgi:muramoyltetrapeptide carboxypeptidase